MTTKKKVSKKIQEIKPAPSKGGLKNPNLKSKRPPRPKGSGAKPNLDMPPKVLQECQEPESPAGFLQEVHEKADARDKKVYRVPVKTLPENHMVPDLKLVKEEVQEEPPDFAYQSPESIKQMDELLKPQVDEAEICPGIRRNVKGHQSARDVLDLIKVEIPEEQKGKRFWEVILAKAQKELGIPPSGKEIKTMDAEQVKYWRRKTMPRGSQKGRTLESILKKKDIDGKTGKEYLYEFATQPDLFCRKLLSFLESIDA